MSADNTKRDIFKELNEIITSAEPDIISSTWIVNNAPRAYRHIFKNYRLDTGGIDWDTVTSHFDRKYQKRWTWYRYKQAKKYERQSEVDLILNRY